jgi:hypothetical protein
MAEYQRRLILGQYASYNSSGLSGDYRSIAVNASGSLFIDQRIASIFAKTINVPNTSGGVTFGSGLTTSGYTVNKVTVCVPAVFTSGKTDKGLYVNSGNTAGVVWLAGTSGNAPYPGNGVMGDGKGLIMPPGTTKEFYVKNLDVIYVAAETSGTPVTITAELLE